MINILERIWKEMIMALKKMYAGIYLKGLRKSTKIFDQGHRTEACARDLVPKYEAGFLFGGPGLVSRSGMRQNNSSQSSEH